jgi:hypothetical protein
MKWTRAKNKTATALSVNSKKTDSVRPAPYLYIHTPVPVKRFTLNKNLLVTQITRPSTFRTSGGAFKTNLAQYDVCLNFLQSLVLPYRQRSYEWPIRFQWVLPKSVHEHKSVQWEAFQLTGPYRSLNSKNSRHVCADSNILPITAKGEKLWHYNRTPKSFCLSLLFMTMQWSHTHTCVECLVYYKQKSNLSKRKICKYARFQTCAAVQLRHSTTWGVPSLCRYLTDFSEQLIGPIFKGQTLQ